MAKRTREVGQNPESHLFDSPRTKEVISIRRRLRHQADQFRRVGLAGATKEMVAAAEKIDVCMRRIQRIALYKHGEIQKAEEATADLRAAIHSYWFACAKWINGTVRAGLRPRPWEDIWKIYNGVQERVLLSERIPGLRLEATKERRTPDVQEIAAADLALWARPAELAATDVHGPIHRATTGSKGPVQTDGETIHFGVRKRRRSSGERSGEGGQAPADVERGSVLHGVKGRKKVASGSRRKAREPRRSSGGTTGGAGPSSV